MFVSDPARFQGEKKREIKGEMRIFLGMIFAFSWVASLVADKTKLKPLCVLKWRTAQNNDVKNGKSPQNNDIKNGKSPQNVTDCSAASWEDASQSFPCALSLVPMPWVPPSATSLSPALTPRVAHPLRQLLNPLVGTTSQKLANNKLNF